MRSISGSLSTLLILQSMVCGLSIQPSTEQFYLVGQDHIWRYLKGTQPPSDPADAWTKVGFDDSAWQTGLAGFGYEDNDDRTILSDMQGHYTTVYIRGSFTCEGIPEDAVLELVIDYDDGFIAYLNGKEVARRNMPNGPADYTTTATSHEAGIPETIRLGPAASLLKSGPNCLAIEGHNASITSNDFSLNPTLRIAGNLTKTGSIWITEVNTISLDIRTAPDATDVMVQGSAAWYLGQPGAWVGQAVLARGLNTVEVKAFDNNGNQIDTGSIGVIYVPPANRFTGPVDANATWAGAVILEGTVTILADTKVTVEPNTWVLMADQARLHVMGQLAAIGTDKSPIYITHLADGTSWRQILFAGARPSILRYCTIEYGGSAGSHVDYYQPGPRSYHEAIVVLASELDIYGCTIQKLPTDAPNAEGDAIAIISDDPNIPGSASARIRACRFIGIGQGIHTRYSFVLVEDCYFQGKRGDNDDIDLYGESDPVPVIRHNLFDVPEHDDRINPTRCSAIIEGNIIMGSDDHGIVLRDRCWPTAVNNLIINCNAGGIAVENSCNALLVNNTIVNCGRGVRLFDLGRWDAPYRLNPGGGTATLINCIIWGCPQGITLSDSSNTSIQDRGSHVTIRHCNIEGGKSAISISGQYSTFQWEEGNLSIDPLFVDPRNGDYRLQAGSGLIDAGTSDNAPSTDLDGYARPCGKQVDIGAYEFGMCQAD